MQREEGGSQPAVGNLRPAQAGCSLALAVFCGIRLWRLQSSTVDSHSSCSPGAPRRHCSAALAFKTEQLLGPLVLQREASHCGLSSSDPVALPVDFIPLENFYQRSLEIDFLCSSHVWYTVQI